MKRVAVVILNWNGKDFLEKFLPSVLSNSSLSNNKFELEVVVADNGSSDNSHNIFSTITENFSKRNSIATRWIQLDKNYGFTGGYNRAIGILQNQNNYDYFLLLNSDIFTPENWLEPLLSFMEEHSDVAVSQPKILSYTASVYSLNTIQTTQEKSHHFDKFEYAGASGGFLDKYGFPFCRGRILSCLEEDRGQYDTPLRTFWASGACMLVRSDVWKKLGGLDEMFFAHMEEIDFCWRCSLLGFQIWCLPQSKVYHVGGGTLPNNSPRKLFFNYRNNLLMLKKNLPAKSVGRKIFIRKLIDLLSALGYCCQFKFSFALAVLKAHKDYNKKRKEIPTSSANALVYGVYHRSIIKKFFLGKRTFNKISPF